MMKMKQKKKQKKDLWDFEKSNRRCSWHKWWMFKNCAPVNRISGNCDNDVKVSKDTNNVQRFFKLCPEEYLTPLDRDMKILIRVVQ